ncbi:YkvI family membrane protein [Caproicibacter fermentans]|uniref:Transporter n=1 Tax=Caproicibacter fermentans TaxID=2576756 RepID=A0A7G8T7N8_9FIRM|nr:hypothetical protein [Caproicibacter fermentans]QNK39629.1 hypothetical protein HCR03_12905 [Caproicibacter fermentans]
MKNKKFVLPAYIGVSAVWFGTHVGPGTASGNQTASYFGAYGKMGLLGGIIAMLLLGFCIYYCIEYSRLIGTTSFKEFTNSFFSPCQKLFSTVFEFAFIWMVIMNFSAALDTGATTLQSQFGLFYWIGIFLFCIVTIVLTMFGAELVRRSSTILTFLILAALIGIVFFGLTSSQCNFIEHWTNTITLEKALPEKPWYELIWSSILYASFLAVGMVGTSLSVSDTLKSKKDSKKATVLGIILNAGLICLVAILLYAYPSVLGDYFDPMRTSKTFIPNLEVVRIIGKPFLTYFYIVILFCAIVSTLEGYGFGVISRYRKFIPVKNERGKDLILLFILLIVGILVSRLGLDWIISKGFRFIGYVEIIFVVLPTLVIGHRKIKQATQEKNEAER